MNRETKVNWLTRDEFIKLILEVDSNHSEILSNNSLGFLIEYYYSSYSSDLNRAMSEYLEVDYKDYMNSLFSCDSNDIRLHSVKRIAILNYE